MSAITHQKEGTTNHEPKLKVPLGGDLLGRECVTGAKRAQMDCVQPEERYENITETPALWHAKQAFLKVKLAFTIVRVKFYLSAHTINKPRNNSSLVVRVDLNPQTPDFTASALITQPP